MRTFIALLLVAVASTAKAENFGELPLNYVLTFTVNTHDPSTGSAADIEDAGVPTYRIYEDETGTAIMFGNMAIFDGTNTVGFYSESITLSAANGFDVGKHYTIRIQATVGGVTGVSTSTLSVSDTRTNLAAVKTKTDFLPSATAGAVGGVFIAGVNAPVTITGSGPALTLTSTGANGAGLLATGHGSGNGISANAPSGGAGLYASSFSGRAAYLQSGTGVGLDIEGGTIDVTLDNQASPDLLTLIGLATGNLDTQLGNVPTVAEFEARTIASASYFDPSTDAVDLGSVLGTAITETGAGDVAGGFTNWFDVATPAKTLNDAGVAGVGLSAEDVWTYGARVLTANTNLNDLDAAGIRAAVGLTSPDLNAQFSGLGASLGTAITQTTAPNIRAAVGLAAADTDMQLDLLSTSIGTAITQTDAAAIRAALGLASPDLDTQLAGVVGGMTQPRVNNPPTWRLVLSNRADATHTATRPVRLRPGTVGDIAVGIDVSPVFGEWNNVVTVGTPVVSGGDITATAAGPRDEAGKQYAMVTLGGTATASETQTVDVPVTMESGEQESVRFTISVFAD